MQCPIEDMNIFTEPCIKLNQKIRNNLKKNFRRNMVVNRSNLKDGFFRCCLFVFEQIRSSTVTLRVSVFLIPLILRFHMISILRGVEHLLNFFKGVCKKFLFGKTSEAVVTIPIHIFLCQLCIDMLAVF